MRKKLLSTIMILLLVLSFAACSETNTSEELITERIENVEIGIPESFEFVEDGADQDYNVFQSYKKSINDNESNLIFISTIDSNYKDTEVDEAAIDIVKDANCDISDIETIELNNNTIGKLFTVPNIEDYNEHTFMFILNGEIFRISLVTKDDLDKSHFRDIVNSIKILSRIDNICFEVPDTYETFTRSEQEDLMGKEMMNTLKDSITYYADISDDSIILNTWCRDTDAPNINSFVKDLDADVTETIDVSSTKGAIVNRGDTETYHNYTLYFIRNNTVYAFDMFSEAETCIDDLKKIAKTIAFI